MTTAGRIKCWEKTHTHMEIDECVHSNYQSSNKAHMRLFLLRPYVIVLIKIFSLTLLKYI